MTYMNGEMFVPLNEWLDVAPDVFDGAKAHSYRASNYQAFEMGMDHLNTDEAYIQSSIEKLDSQFDLVILVEYFLESLVLLANLLCIPYEVLYTPRRNALEYEIQELTNSQMMNYRSLFKQDIALYDYFNRTLQGKSEQIVKKISY